MHGLRAILNEGLELFSKLFLVELALECVHQPAPNIIGRADANCSHILCCEARVRGNLETAKLECAGVSSIETQSFLDVLYTQNSIINTPLA